MSSRLRHVLAVCTVLGFFAGSSITNAQQVFGSIFGTVTDPAGGSVPNAKVTITDVNKNTTSRSPPMRPAITTKVS